MTMSWITLTTLLLLARSGFLAVIDICQLKGNDLVIHRNYKTGETLCCRNVKCSPGEEAVMCDRDDPLSTSCRNCSDGTYQSEARDSADMLHCAVKTQCYGNLSARNEKSKTGDTRCICDPKIGFCNPDGITKNPPRCVKKTCPQGFQLTSKCACEVCSKPTNKSRTEQKPPCDKRNRPCRKRRESSTSELDSGTACPEDNLETSTEVATIDAKNGDAGNTGLTSPSGGNEYISPDQVSWYIILFAVISVVVCVVAIVWIVLWWKGFCKRQSDLPKNASAESSSTDDTELGDVAIEPSKAESLSLMPHVPKCSSEVAMPCKPDAGEDSDAVKPSDKEKLQTQRPYVVKNLVFGEYLWAILESNETITSEMRAKIEHSSSSDSEKAGALVTCLLKRDPRAFVTFLVALIYTKQEHIAKALDPALTLDISQRFPEDDQLISYAQSLV